MAVYKYNKQMGNNVFNMTPAEDKEISRMWKRIERKWHVKIEDVSVEMSMAA